MIINCNWAKVIRGNLGAGFAQGVPAFNSGWFKLMLEDVSVQVDRETKADGLNLQLWFPIWKERFSQSGELGS